MMDAEPTKCCRLMDSMLFQRHNFLMLGNGGFNCCVNCGMTFDEISKFGRTGLFNLCSAPKGTRTLRAQLAINAMEAGRSPEQRVVLERVL